AIDTCTLPLHDALPIFARQEAEYLGQIPHHREPLIVDTWIGHMGGASMLVCYEVRSPDRAELYAQATTTVVMLDASTGRPRRLRSEEHTSELQSRENLV